MGLLNLLAVESSLRQVQKDFAVINQHLSGQRDPLGDEVIANLLAGYAYVDTLVEKGIDVFVMGQHKYLLELNNIVLCGQDQSLRTEFAGLIAATKDRFYDEPGGGIEDLVEWRARHRDVPVWELAAGLYVRVLSKPQLFIEGNHRTGALVASYVLLRHGKPPFVLTPENAATYFEPSTVLRDIGKLGPIALFRLPGLIRRVARFLQEQANPAYLLTLGTPGIAPAQHPASDHDPHANPTLGHNDAMP